MAGKRRAHIELMHHSFAIFLSAENIIEEEECKTRSWKVYYLNERFLPLVERFIGIEFSLKGFVYTNFQREIFLINVTKEKSMAIGMYAVGGCLLNCYKHCIGRQKQDVEWPIKSSVLRLWLFSTYTCNPYMNILLKYCII